LRAVSEGEKALVFLKGLKLFNREKEENKATWIGKKTSKRKRGETFCRSCPGAPQEKTSKRGGLLYKKRSRPGVGGEKRC